MHQKSQEASATLNESDDPTKSAPSDDHSPSKNKDDLKSESIAALRAKAQEHSVKMSLSDYQSLGHNTHAHAQDICVDGDPKLPLHQNNNHCGGQNLDLGYGYLNPVN